VKRVAMTSRSISLTAVKPWDITKHGSGVVEGASGVKNQPRRVTLSLVWKAISSLGILLVSYGLDEVLLSLR